MTNHNLEPKSKGVAKSVKAHSAESQMVTSVLTTHGDSLVKSVQEQIIKKVEEFDTISYIYVLNKSEKLVGIISVQELFAAPNSAKIKDVMVKEVHTARLSTHKEKVALLALKHHIKAVPIVDKHGVFKGIVPSDAILSILNNSHIEDVLLSAGISGSDDPLKSIFEPSIKYHLQRRFPWLILGMGASMITTFIVGSFDTMLEKHILLATFIPAIVYMSDAVGNQTQTIFIKAMTISNKVDFFFYFFREVKVALALGMVLSSLVFAFSAVAWKQPILSFIFSFSLLMAVIGATMMAVGLPMVLRRLKIDPAIATGPVASVMRDIYSLSIYLGLASLLLNMFA